MTLRPVAFGGGGGAASGSGGHGGGIHAPGGHVGGIGRIGHGGFRTVRLHLVRALTITIIRTRGLAAITETGVGASAGARYGYITPVIATGVATSVVSAPIANRCNCLTKEYTQEGAVVFKDLCTQEMAMNPPQTTPPQAAYDPAAPQQPMVQGSLQPQPQYQPQPQFQAQFQPQCSRSTSRRRRSAEMRSMPRSREPRTSIRGSGFFAGSKVRSASLRSGLADRVAAQTDELAPVRRQQHAPMG